MNDERIAHLLKRADAPPPPENTSDLAARVRARSRRIDRVRASVASCVVLIGVGAIAVILLRSPTRKSPLAVIPPHYATQAELKQLDAEATRHAAIAQRLMEIETPAPSSTTKLELARDLQLQRDEAALSLIYQAELAPPPDAVALYRKTIDLFPDTHWAALAKQRIAALDATQENL